jgi:hypothetical protein
MNKFLRILCLIFGCYFKLMDFDTFEKVEERFLTKEKCPPKSTQKKLKDSQVLSLKIVY